MDAIAIEEVLGRPLATLLLCAVVPLGTARLLWVTVVGTLPSGGPREEARALAPFRGAAFLVGLVQLQLAWMAGVTALGPALVDAPDSLWCEGFGALSAIVAFCAGGVGRLVEEKRWGAVDVRAAIALRLRLVPWFGGPVLAASLVSRLPTVDWSASAPSVRWGVVAIAFVLSALGTAYGGLLLAMALRALVPATADVRAIAEDVAAREGVKLLAVLRLPTGAAKIANAAAIPWARTMVVSDHIVALLDPSELRAVLAHEAGHLSEGPWVVLGRLGTAIALLFVLTTGVRVGAALHPDGPWIVLFGGILLAVPALLMVRRLARRMEERADARARSNAGSASLADALTKLHEDARMPLVTGARRVHPDLYDRLVACGRDPGPRPLPPNRRIGLVAGALTSTLLVAAVASALTLTSIDLADAPLAGSSSATWRLRVDPWDGTAMLALAWATRRADDLGLAEAQQRMAAHMGAPRAESMELEAELLAAHGLCDEARARFDRALATRASTAFEDPFAPLELGGWHLPPTLVTDCGYGAEDLVGPVDE